MGEKNRGKRKLRAQFRKRYDRRSRKRDFTADARQAEQQQELAFDERISGKGRLTRKRTVIGVETELPGGIDFLLDVPAEQCVGGRVLRVHGLATIVQSGDGGIYECSLRGLLKSLASDLQHVVIAGDAVMIKPINEKQGVIVRVETRRGVLSRTSRGRRQIIVANVDQIIIVCSAAEPRLKPNLVDRFLVSAEQSDIRPVICINKIDLVDAADLQPVVGVWGQMGYVVLLVSAKTGTGTGRLRDQVIGRDSVVVGQSGVGKSSLLNRIQPGLDLRVNQISADSQKGRHTTSAAQLIPLDEGGHLVDTPGIRQFQLWDIIAAEVEGLFPEIRPFVNLCHFPNCCHIHEEKCAVKDAVADGKIDVRRYESYCQMFEENRVSADS